MPTITKKSKDKVLPLAVALSPDTDKKVINDPLFYPPSEDGLHVSEETYWADYYEHPDFNYEWNNGILEEKGMSDRYTYLMYMWFTQLILEYLKYNPIAQTIGLETGGRILLPHKTAIRKPDLGIVLNSNPIPYQGNDKSYQGTFDMCVEAISKSRNVHKTRDTIDKKEDYALGGVKEYYILDGEKEETAFYHLDTHGEYKEIKSEDGIIRSNVLPNFQFRLSDLYKRPPVEELRHDEVYKHFVALNLQTAEAEIEHLKALLNKHN